MFSSLCQFWTRSLRKTREEIAMHNSFVHTVKRFSYLAMVLVLGSACLMARR